MLDDKKRIELAKRLVNALQSQLSFIKNSKHYGTNFKNYYKNSTLSKIKFINYLLDKTTFFDMSKYLKDEISNCDINIFYNILNISYKASFKDVNKALFMEDIDDKIFEPCFMAFLDKVAISTVEINGIDRIELDISFKNSNDIRQYIITIPDDPKGLKITDVLDNHIRMTSLEKRLPEEYTKKIETANNHRKEIITELRNSLENLIKEENNGILGLLGVYNADVEHNLHLNLSILKACERLFTSFYRDKPDMLEMEVYYLPRGSEHRYKFNAAIDNTLFDVDLYDTASYNIDHLEGNVKSGIFYSKVIEFIKTIARKSITPLEIKLIFNYKEKASEEYIYDLTNGSILSSNK